MIHTNIKPFSTHCFNGRRYFISFIDNRSRYMYIYILNGKGEAVDGFKSFKIEVKEQKEKKIEIVRSNRGEEYYGRYTKKGQVTGPCKIP